MASFERHKKKADPDKRNDVTVDIPFEFDRHFAQLTNRDLAEVLHDKEKRYDVVYLPDAGKLLLKWSAVKRLFDPVIEQLKDEILKVRNNIPFRRLQYMSLSLVLIVEKKNATIFFLRLRCVNKQSIFPSSRQINCQLE